jgi:methionyl-tRNA formyltransferase
MSYNQPWMFEFYLSFNNNNKVKIFKAKVLKLQACQNYSEFSMISYVAKDGLWVANEILR